MGMKKNIVISLGGSIMHPDMINTEYIRKFVLFIKAEIKKGNKFIIITGGGSLARKFQKAAGACGTVSDAEKDWLGIQATRMHALLLRSLFGSSVYPEIIVRRGQVRSFGKYKIIIGGGWAPGWSTDFVSVQLAADFKIDMVVNLGKPAYVYTRDNVRFPDAKPLPQLTWNEYFAIIPKKWKPGMHAPIDPIAARLAKKEGMRMAVASGNDIVNIRNIFKGRPFKGTLVQ
jgi:uridylate kinase